MVGLIGRVADRAENMDSKTSVVLTAVDDLDKAEVLCAVLRGRGFDAYVVDPNASRSLWHLNLAINPDGIRVAVRADQADQARQALLELEREAGQEGETLLPPEELPPEDEPEPNQAPAGAAPQDEPLEADQTDEAPDADPSPEAEGQPDSVARPEEATADFYARKAAMACLFSFFVAPIILLAVSHFIKALVLPRKTSPGPSRYLLWMTISLLIISGWILVILVSIRAMGR